VPIDPRIHPLSEKTVPFLTTLFPKANRTAKTPRLKINTTADCADIADKFNSYPCHPRNPRFFPSWRLGGSMNYSG
jgi:hypothetical protein